MDIQAEWWLNVRTLPRYQTGRYLPENVKYNRLIISLRYRRTNAILITYDQFLKIISASCFTDEHKFQNTYFKEETDCSESRPSL